MTDDLDFVLADPDSTDTDFVLKESTTIAGQQLSRSGSGALVLNLTGITVLSPGMLRLLVDAQRQGRPIEILNPSLGIQEALRTARLESCLLIRGKTLWPHETAP